MIPVLCVAVAVGVAFLTLEIDDGKLIPASVVGGPDAALAILGGIAASMVTLTATVLTIVLVVVQLAMGQFSPRIVRTVLRDRPSQFAIGIFAGTFAHALISMQGIASTDKGDPFPGLAVLVALALAVISTMVLIAYTHHVGQTLRVAALVESIGDETRAVIEKGYCEGIPEPDVDGGRFVVAPHSGVIFRLDEPRLVKVAQRADCTLIGLPAVGDFVPRGAPLFRVDGDPSGLEPKRVLAAVSLGPERTMNQDAAYGFRMLVDIAQRSISDANDDPTTAVSAIDRLHDCLRQLAGRPFPSGEHHDDAGELRLVCPTIGWDGYVRLAFDELRQASVRAHSLQVTRRLSAALADLKTVAPPERQAALDRQQRLLDADLEQELEGVMVQDGWTVPDAQGIGSAVELQLDVGVGR